MRVLETIGQGGSGIVYRALDMERDRTVALKVCTSEDPKERLRFARGARVECSLSHPHIVGAEEMGAGEDGSPYVVQELIEGDDLHSLINEGRLPALDHRMRWMVELASRTRLRSRPGRSPSRCQALQYPHYPRWHPQATRLRRCTCRLRGSADHGRGEPIGSVAYMAPEVFQGEEPSSSVDVFSWGVVAYELISGRRPFEGESMHQLTLEILTHQPTPPSNGHRTLRALDDLVLRCLHKAPEQRPTSLAEVGDSLARRIGKVSGGFVIWRSGPSEPLGARWRRRRETHGVGRCAPIGVLGHFYRRPPRRQGCPKSAVARKPTTERAGRRREGRLLESGRGTPIKYFRQRR